MKNYPDVMYDMRADGMRQITGLLTSVITEMQDRAFLRGMEEYTADHYLMNIVRKNIDNADLSDAVFRQIIRNNIK